MSTRSINLSIHAGKSYSLDDIGAEFSAKPKIFPSAGNFFRFPQGSFQKISPPAGAQTEDSAPLLDEYFH